MMQRVLILSVVFAFSLASSIALAETTKQPNIVLLISDDDDYEHFGFNPDMRCSLCAGAIVTIT